MNYDLSSIERVSRQTRTWCTFVRGVNSRLLPIYAPATLLATNSHLQTRQKSSRHSCLLTSVRQNDPSTIPPNITMARLCLQFQGFRFNATGLCTLTVEGITVNHIKFCSALLYTYLQRHAIQMSLSLSPHPNSSSSPSPSLSPGLSPSPSPRKCSPSNALRATG